MKPHQQIKESFLLPLVALTRKTKRQLQHCIPNPKTAITSNGRLFLAFIPPLKDADYCHHIVFEPAEAAFLLTGSC